MWYSVHTFSPTFSWATEKLVGQDKLQQYQVTFPEASVWVLKAVHRKRKHTNRTECATRCVWHHNCTSKERGRERREKYGHHPVQHQVVPKLNPQPEVDWWRILIAGTYMNDNTGRQPCPKRTIKMVYQNSPRFNKLHTKNIARCGTSWFIEFSTKCSMTKKKIV